MNSRFDTYLKALAAAYRDGGTEHSGRTALENLLSTFAAETLAPGTTVQHEPKRDADKGAPDFKVKRAGMILGYVEVKEIGANLDKVLKSEQIAKYRKLSDNIVLTDYLQFIRIDAAGKVIAREQLAYPSDIESRTLRVNPEHAGAVAKLLTAFLSSPPIGLSESPKLAEALAARSRLLRDYLVEEMIAQEKAKHEGRLHALFDVFREQVFHELTIKEFADAFAQMLAYGLFLAKLSAGDDDVIALDNVRRFIPGSFRLIRELVRFLEEMREAEYDEAQWVVEEILSIVNGLNIDAIRESLSFSQRKAISRKVRAGDEEEHRLFERDPFIYFYEDFLKAYDKETRKGRGVYYTPPPVVNFIVRAVDDILKDTFKIGDGLADNRRVTVLDFATGTGTFLLEVMQRIFENIGGPDAGKADRVVRDHMLKNLYGFEYLVAPYTIAHLKLSQYLKDKGHPLHDDERLQVFLTNTLEPVEPQKNLLLPAISAEVEAAQEIKEKPILVIIGNPPYAARSKNKGDWITAAIEAYKLVDGKPFGEKKHWLHDDYVKFIRFAQLKMDAVKEGVVGIITNHSWLDNPTFRGMRQSLMLSFDQIYVLDLHGNAKKKERSLDGGVDENVFDIEQGVSISVLIKKSGLDKGIWRGDVWGTRLEKYQKAAVSEFFQCEWKPVNPERPDFLFITFDRSIGLEYGAGTSIPNIFSERTAGVITARDHFAIAFDQIELENRIDDFVWKAHPVPDTRGWKASEAREKLRRQPDWKERVKPILQAPFDRRIFPHDSRLIDWGRWSFYNSISGNCIGLCSVRKLDIQDWTHVFVADEIISHHALSMKEVDYFFPVNFDGHENLSADFRSFLDARYEHHYSPEEILGYIYAVLHAPAYRRRYAEFLRIDFPRIPFPEKAEDFTALSRLGWALVQAHLLRDLPRAKLADYHGKGNHVVEYVRWSAEDERISINKTQSFAPVPEAVWNFHIGGYQVIDKYLKSRKGRALSLDEINHVGRIADALAFTIAQMKRIAVAYQQAFPDRG
jgi:hypothetical protein